MVFLRRTALTAFVAVAFVASIAFGQPPAGYPIAPPPIRMPQPPAQTSANAGVALPPQAMAAPPPTAYPAAAYNPYGYPGYQGRVGGALSGAANVISAQGQFEQANQQARITQTQADMSRIDYRNALINQQRYEKSLLPTTVELRQQEQWKKLQSARNNPPNPEIWSGDALNAILTALQGADMQGLRAESVPLDQDMLKHINLTTGQASGAGAGMLKSVTNLAWPFALQDAPFVTNAATINMLAQKAVDEVKAKGRVTAPTFKELDSAVAAMSDAVASNQTLSPTDYIESKGFLNDLRSSIQSLRDPKVAGYLSGAYAAQGQNVDELVQKMTMQGLHFAPATQDDETAYTILYQALRSYDYRLAQLASR